MGRRWPNQAVDGLARAASLAGLLSVVLTASGQLLARFWWPLELPSHFTAYYAAALAPTTALLLARTRFRRPWLGAACGAALLVNLWLLSPYLLPGRQANSSGKTLRVMTLNVLTANQRYEDVIRLVEQTDPDVLALIEVNTPWIEALQPLLAAYPHVATLPRSDNFGVALLTRLPDARLEVLDLANTDTPSIVAALRHGDRNLSLLATHPLPPIGAEYSAERNRHLAAIKQWAHDAPGEVVVMGDLNVTPWSPYFHDLTSGGRLRDGAAGQGLSATWWVGGGLIGIPIDHVLVSSGLAVAHREVGPDVGSDHRAVIVDLTLSD